MKKFFTSKIARVVTVLVMSTAIIAATLFHSSSVYADDPTITEFPAPFGIYSIANGSDGNLWFTVGGANKIGSITPTGTITEFPIPTSSSYPLGITSGPDGNLWFTEMDANQIGRITPAGIVTEFPIPTSNTNPFVLTSGPDGNLWFTESGGNNIGMITPAGTITEFPIPTSNGVAVGITTGPDGNLWFTEESGNKIGRVTPAGVVTEFSLSPNSQPERIISGSDGNLWFTEYATHNIGRITPTGTITEFLVPTNSSPLGITSGPDGNIWFTEQSGNNIGKITPAGVITELPIPSSTLRFGITTGPDGNIWYTDYSGNIGRVNLSSVTSTPTPTITPTPTPTTTVTPTPTPSSGLQYVALGDSYSAGEGAPNPDYIFGTDLDDNRCHRSTAAYPYLLANALGLPIETFFFEACAGAEIRDFYHGNGPDKKREQPQRNWLNTVTTLVTLTIGGNDAGFPDVMEYCARRTIYEKLCQKKFQDDVTKAIDRISSPKSDQEHSLPKLFAEIRRRSPNAKVLVVGYPRLFPKIPPVVCLTGAPDHRFPLPASQLSIFVKSDMEWMNEMAKQLDYTIATAAANAGFTYIDNYNAMDGHELCTGDPYLNRAITAPRNSIQKWSFHPNIQGQQVLKENVAVSL